MHLSTGMAGRRASACRPEQPPTRSTDALLRIGFEVEDVHTVPPTEGPLVVGTVLSIEELTGLKKPIRFCTVDVGPGNGPDGSDRAPRNHLRRHQLRRGRHGGGGAARCGAARRFRDRVAARPTAGSPTG